MHTGTLMPYEIIRPFTLAGKDWMRTFPKRRSKSHLKQPGMHRRILQEIRNALVVIDGSGSMYGGGNPMPVTVAQSLGLYFAEKIRELCKSFYNIFKDHSLLR